MTMKTMALAGALLLTAGLVQAQQPTTRPTDTSSAVSKPGNVTRGTLDINTASRSELAAAGWGNYADAIIAGRPYKSMNDLVDKRIVPQTAYDKGAEKFQVGGAVTDPAATPSTTPGAPTTPPAPGASPTTPGTTPTTPGTTPTTPGSPTPTTPGTTPSTPGTTAPPGAQAPPSSAAPTR